MKEKFSEVFLLPLMADKVGSPAYEVSEPHRHDYYYCVLLERGSMHFEVDFQPVSLISQSLFLLYPGQLHRVIAARPQQGWYLAFAPALLTEQLRDVLDQCLSEVVQLTLTTMQTGHLSQLLHHAAAVYAYEEQPLRPSILQALVQAFMYQVAAAYQSHEKRVLGLHSGRQLELTKAFRQLLRQRYLTLRRPAEFAAALHVSASHLNDTVRAVTGFPVTYHIQQEIMREAQRLLVQPDLSISEVAYRLHFDDAKYFTRLFRKVVGASPGAFRQPSEVDN